VSASGNNDVMPKAGEIVGLATCGEIRDDFETAVMQSIVGSGGAGTN
jgi:hypothetical protein